MGAEVYEGSLVENTCDQACYTAKEVYKDGSIVVEVIE